MHRRALFRHGVHTGVALASTASVAHAQATGSTPGIITIIDIDRCDGCRHLHMPRCVAACRQEKISEIPEPKRPLQPYWPQTRFEDYSDQRERFDRLTPYNLTFVQTVEVKGRHLHIPRRCMHCYDAPCRKLCPFGAIERTQQGAVRIDYKICFGGAKCRDVCPWEIPQRQAGVGLYLDIAPKFAGGGLMYKCDLCASRLERGKAAGLHYRLSPKGSACRLTADDECLARAKPAGPPRVWSHRKRRNRNLVRLKCALR